MDYKIVFSDIDGTLLNKDRELSPATIQAIKRLKERVPLF
jgi:hydroxymethylpyrimidine pyrophosphatase-like HAD family hydrolase